MWHPSPRLDSSSLFPCFVLLKSVSRNSLVLCLGSPLSCFVTTESWTSFPDQTCFFLPSPPPVPTPPRLLHRLTTLSSSSPSFLPPFLYPPPFISHFSWTPSMRYSVSRHRYGRLSLLTVILSWPFPVSHQCDPLLLYIRGSSLFNQQGGGLPLCGLHVQYGLLINVFVLFPLGNKKPCNETLKSSGAHIKCKRPSVRFPYFSV